MTPLYIGLLLGVSMFKVLINPLNDEKGTGLTSFASWQNPDTLAGLQRIFNVTQKERLIQVEVDSQGITVRLESVPSK